MVSVEFCTYVMPPSVSRVWFFTGSWPHKDIHWSLSHKFTKPRNFSSAFFVISYFPPSVCQCHGHLSDSFPFSLGTFAKLWKATISFIMSVCPSIHMEQLGPHYTNIHEIWYLRVFQKFVEKIQVWLKSDKDNKDFTWRPTYIYDHILLNSF